jgi:hypothetical protein
MQVGHSLIDAVVVEGDALAHCDLYPQSPASKRTFGWALLAEQPIVLVETIDQGLGDRLGDRIFAGWNIHFLTYERIMLHCGG